MDEVQPREISPNSASVEGSKSTLDWHITEVDFINDILENVANLSPDQGVWVMIKPLYKDDPTDDVMLEFLHLNEANAQ